MKQHSRTKCIDNKVFDTFDTCMLHINNTLYEISDNQRYREFIEKDVTQSKLEDNCYKMHVTNVNIAL